ncbi:hypothetical protein EXIGLDRAFT_838382 [Exidia glandulosa HHB12029]|uniref:Uncharacterized protein n=1 Tax=Exidia glandulosa HHB12029 TaxID=1314781 RepID=A0A165FXD8_EXIGL|nr:hypothetical protein EXIGLDRAFT_838382 [Exidia glandulosa HHB12029]
MGTARASKRAAQRGGGKDQDGNGDDATGDSSGSHRGWRDRQSSSDFSSAAMLSDNTPSLQVQLDSLRAAYDRQRIALAVTSVLLALCLLGACIGLTLMYVRLRRARLKNEALVAQSETKVLFSVPFEDPSPPVAKPRFSPVLNITRERDLPGVPQIDNPPSYHQPRLEDALAREGFTAASATSKYPAPQDAVSSSQSQTSPAQRWQAGPFDAMHTGGPLTGSPARRQYPHPELKLTIMPPSQKGSPTATTAVNSDSPDTALRPTARSVLPFESRARLSVPVTAVPVSSYSSSMSPVVMPTQHPAISDFLDRLSVHPRGENRTLSRYAADFALQNYQTIDELRGMPAAQLRQRIPGMADGDAEFICRMVEEELLWLDRQRTTPRGASTLDENAFPVVLDL